MARCDHDRSAIAVRHAQPRRGFERTHRSEQQRLTMQTPRISLLFRLGSALALVLVIAGCTKGGQFDPTEMFSSDVFDSKKKLTGEREPLFPNGVPGTTTGVPPDLVKGYQAPPDQADASATTPPPAGSAPGAPAPAATAEVKPE